MNLQLSLNYLKLNNWIKFPEIFQAIFKSYRKLKIIFDDDIINESNYLELSFNVCKYDLE